MKHLYPRVIAALLLLFAITCHFNTLSSGLALPASWKNTPATIIKTITVSGLNIASNADVYFRWLLTDAVAAYK